MATSFIVKSNFCTDTYDVNVLWRKSSTLNFYSDIAKFERNDGFPLYGPIINDFKRKVFFNFSKESAENILCKTPTYDLHYLFRTFSGNQKFHSLGCICKENFKCLNQIGISFVTKRFGEFKIVHLLCRIAFQPSEFLGTNFNNLVKICLFCENCTIKEINLKNNYALFCRVENILDTILYAACRHGCSNFLCSTYWTTPDHPLAFKQILNNSLPIYNIRTDSFRVPTLKDLCIIETQKNSINIFELLPSSLKICKLPGTKKLDTLNFLILLEVYSPRMHESSITSENVECVMQNVFQEYEYNANPNNAPHLEY